MGDDAAIRNTAATLFRAALASQGVDGQTAEARARELSVALPGEGADIYTHIDDVKAVLASPSGEYGERSFAQRLAEDPGLAARVADPERRKGMLAPDPRVQIRRLMYASLRPEDWPAGAGDPAVRDLAGGLEKGAYNATIEHFKATSRQDKCRWANAEFRVAYSSRAGAVAAALESGGAALLRDRGSEETGAVDWNGLGYEVGRMDECAINPAPLQALREEFEARRHIKVKKRMSHLYRCPKCGAMEAETREIQMRSADEPPTIMCTCVCGVVYRGAG